MKMRVVLSLFGLASAWRAKWDTTNQVRGDIDSDKKNSDKEEDEDDKGEARAALAESFLLEDAVNKTGARCLDGSPVRYWFRRALSKKNATKWHVHLMGGGWCFTSEQCADRAFLDKSCYLGSSDEKCFKEAEYASKSFKKRMSFEDIPYCNGARFCGGLINDDPETNPMAHDWNQVFVHYCDGGSFLGHAKKEVEFKGEKREIYFRGRANFDAVFEDLMEKRGMKNATDLILGGDDAGGLAVMMHLDDVAEKFKDKKSTKVVGVVDSGFYYHDELLKGTDSPVWSENINTTFRMMRSEKGDTLLSKECLNASKENREDHSRCHLPEEAGKYIKTPFFIVQSRYDPVINKEVAGIVDGQKHPNKVQTLGKELKEKILDVVDHDEDEGKNRHGAFITGCAEHGGQWAQKQNHTDDDLDDFYVKINGTTAVEAFQKWWNGDRFTWVQNARFPCEHCCDARKGGAAGQSVQMNPLYLWIPLGIITALLIVLAFLRI